MFETSAMYMTFTRNIIKEVTGGYGAETLNAEEITEDHVTGVNVAVASLRPLMQDALKLKFMQEKSYEEVAESLVVGKEYAHSLVQEAICMLRDPDVLAFILNGFQGNLNRLKSVDSRRYVDAFNNGYLKAKADTVERSVIDVAEEVDEEDAPVIADADNKYIEELEFSVRTYNCLKRSGYNRLSNIIAIEPSKIFKIRNLGRKSADEVARKLRELGYPDTAWADHLM